MSGPAAGGGAGEAGLALVRGLFQAYVDGDGPAIEAILAEGFRFHSPCDNGLDRAGYLAVCWPGHERIAGFRFERLFAHGDEVVVTYEQARRDGTRVRNTEVLTVRDGRVQAVEVYFGWSVPHPAPEGRHLPPAG